MRKIYHATRRWQCDYVGMDYKPKPKRANKRLISLIKRTAFLPPVSLFHTARLLKFKDALSFAPSIPLRKGHKIALENYDSLFDYNSVKRVIFQPLIFFILLFARGSFLYYSNTSLKSVPKVLRSLKVFKTSSIEDFFKLSEVHAALKKRPKHKQIICVGDFFYKGGKETFAAFQDLKLGSKHGYRIVIFVPKSQLEEVTSLTAEAKEHCHVHPFNEASPDFFYEKLAESAILVHATFHDSHAIVVKEAVQLGCRTIATDVFDVATNADVVLSAPDPIYKNYRYRLPLSGQRVIAKYSNPSRSMDMGLKNSICAALSKELTEKQTLNVSSHYQS